MIPTGYSFNLDGTAIYLTLAAMFIAQATDMHLTLMQDSRMLGVMLLTSKGAAGVTGSGFVALGGHADGCRTCRWPAGADRRHRPLHVGGARAHQHDQQRGLLHRGVDLGERVRPRGAGRELAVNYAGTESELEGEAVGLSPSFGGGFRGAVGQ